MVKHRPFRLPVAELRRRVLEGVPLEPVPEPLPESTLVTWRKTSKLLMLEYRYKLRIEDFLWRCSLAEVVVLLGGEVDKSTVSRWRAAAEKEVAHEG